MKVRKYTRLPQAVPGPPSLANEKVLGTGGSDPIMLPDITCQQRNCPRSTWTVFSVAENEVAVPTDPKHGSYDGKLTTNTRCLTVREASTFFTGGNLPVDQIPAQELFQWMDNIGAA